MLIFTCAIFEHKYDHMCPTQKKDMEICISLNKKDPIIIVLFRHFVIFV